MTIYVYEKYAEGIADAFTSKEAACCQLLKDYFKEVAPSFVGIEDKGSSSIALRIFLR